MIEDRLLELIAHYSGEEAARVEMLPASGSARKYYRIFCRGRTFIGAYHENIEENRLFIDFSRHFHAKGLRVPMVYAESNDSQMYIQEDLGDMQLLDWVVSERKKACWTPFLTTLYRKSLSELLRFQVIGGEGLDYSRCIPRPAFDRRCILWDLNYFKYCFLRLAGADFSEERLENDFECLAGQLASVPTDGFMFRDFQSRNIMVREGEVCFIDYQGGRQGALQYDVASLLYDAIVRVPDEEREKLLTGYIQELQNYRVVNETDFRTNYYRFALIRLLQAMGAFGLRGLYEGKQHFLDSIAPGVETVVQLFEKNKFGEAYPEIRRVLVQLSLRYSQG